jgi:hypothetical protein
MAAQLPVRKIASDLDIGCPAAPATGPIWRPRAALGMLTKGGSGLVFYNAGVDPHRDDRLGRLALTDEGLRGRDTMVIAHFRALGMPVCGVIGGGYSGDIEVLAGAAILFGGGRIATQALRIPASRRVVGRNRGRTGRREQYGLGAVGRRRRRRTAARHPRR